MNVVIAHGLAPHAQALDALPTTGLPNVMRFLSRSGRGGDLGVPAESTAAPHELARARALQITPAWGSLPWAAWQSCTVDRWCAWLSPCHWQVGRNDARLIHPVLLDLDDDESRGFMEAAAPLLRSDGIEIRFHDAMHWLVAGDVLQGLSAASMDRLATGALQHWLECWTGSQQLRRLQNELQMVLHEHPLNIQREQCGFLPVNAVWFHGAGRIDANPASPVPDGTVRMIDQLKRPALAGDWAQWGKVWAELDATAPAWLDDASHVAICGTHTCRFARPGKAAWGARLMAAFASGDNELGRWLVES